MYIRILWVASNDNDGEHTSAIRLTGMVITNKSVFYFGHQDNMFFFLIR